MNIKKHPMQSFRGSVFPVFAVAIAYWVTGLLSLLLAIPPGYATAIWPASGIALVVVLVYGIRVWPGILIGSFLTNISMGTGTTLTFLDLKEILVPLGIGAGAACQAIVGAFLVRRYAGFPNLLASERDIFLFLFWGGAIACLVNSFIGVSILWFAGIVPESNFFVNLGTWWIGDTVGVLVFAPVLLVWLLQPRDVWAPRALTVSVPIAVTFVLAVATVAFAANWERQRMKLQFDRQVSPIIQSLKKTLGEYVGVLHFLEGFHAASSHVSREDFGTFVKRPLSELAGLQALSWNPLVPDGERTAFEESIRQEGFPDFQIMERDADGQLVRAANRPEYTVVNFVEPFSKNIKAFGFDVASSAPRREALAIARDSGNPVATARITLVQEQGQQFGVLVFMPVYRRGMPTDTVEDRRENLAGYSVGVFRGGDIIAAAFGDLDTTGVSYRLVDTSASETNQLLIENQSQDDTIFSLEEKGVFGGSVNFSAKIPISFGGRAWRLEVSPNQEFFAKHREKTEWLILIGGMLLTSLVSVFVMVLSGRKELLRRLVDERTNSLKVALEEAESASKVKSEFLSVVSHELRTPLTSIRGALGMLSAQLVAESSEGGAKLIEIASRNSQRLGELVDDILDIEKFQSGNFDLDMNEIDTCDLVTRSVEANRPYAQRLGVDIVLGTDKPRLSISGDEGRLLQVLANLISNAAKFSPTGETVIISWNEYTLHTQGKALEAVRISVADKGPGIPESFRQRIFTPFEQADSSSTRGIGGTGLGLSICKVIAEQHGGAMSFETDIGKGTTFHLDLPRAVAAINT